MAMAPVMDISSKTTEQLMDIIASVERDIDELSEWIKLSPNSAVAAVWLRWIDNKAALLTALLEEVAQREAKAEAA